MRQNFVQVQLSKERQRSESSHITSKFSYFNSLYLTNSSTRCKFTLLIEKDSAYIYIFFMYNSYKRYECTRFNEKYLYMYINVCCVCMQYTHTFFLSIKMEERQQLCIDCQFSPQQNYILLFYILSYKIIKRVYYKKKHHKSEHTAYVCTARASSFYGFMK